MSEPIRDRAPWEQLGAESAKAYEAALTYFQLGTLRTVRAVSNELARRRGGPTKATKGSKKPQKSANRSGSIGQWSRQFRWAERAAAWDAHQNDLKNEAIETARKEQAAQEAKDWIDRRRQLSVSQWNVFSSATNRMQDIIIRDQQARQVNDPRFPKPSQAEFDEALAAFTKAAVHGQAAVDRSAPLPPIPTRVSMDITTDGKPIDQRISFIRVHAPTPKIDGPPEDEEQV